MRRTSYLLTFLTALALVALVWAALPSPAAAKTKAPPAPTRVDMPQPAPGKLGEPLMVSVRLLDAAGKPLSDRALNFFIDLTYVGQARTDSSGKVVHRIRKEVLAGEHMLTVRFAGAQGLLPSVQTRKLVVKPAIVTVQTVPPTAGVSFSMDGRSYLTGADGVAEIPMYKAGRYLLHIDVEKYKSDTMRIEFSRWQMEAYQPVREVDVPSDAPIQAGINVYQRVGQTFVDLDGNPVDTRRISKITIRSIHGDVFTYTDGAMRWIPATRVARRASGLEVTPLQYSVMNVTVDGSNVVNQAQQRFFAEPEKVVQIQLLLYSMRISTHDALLGSSVGSHVQVDYPNGEVHTYPLDATGKLEIPSLARGIYKIQVLGVGGMISPTPVALSRDQEVAVKVLTNLDMGLAGAAGLFVALGLLLVGRPWLLRGMLRSKRVEVEPQAEGYVTFHNN